MKRLLCALLAGLLALGTLSGCGGGPSPESSTGGGTESTSSTAEVTDPMAKYDPPITVKMARSIDASIDQDLESWGMTWDDNVWTQTLRDDYGINVEYVFLSQGDDFKTKFNATIASGDLLDVGVYDATQLAQLHENDLIVNMQPYYDSYASDLMKEMVYTDGGLMMKSATLGGDLAAIPSMCDPRCDIIYLRQDWLDKLGLEGPSTMEDFWNIAKAFSEQDPDGNGQDDTFGLSLSKDLSSVGSIKAVLNGYHAYWNQWIKKDDGSIVYSNVQPEFRTALEVMQQMYAEGVIDPEFVTKDGSKIGEDAASQKTGMVTGEWWMSEWPLNASYDANPDVDVNWKAYPLVSADDQVVKPQHGLPIQDGYYAVREGYEHPEALIKMFNLWWLYMYGDVDEETYRKYSNGPNKELYWKLSPAVSFIGKDVRGEDIERAFETGDTSKLTLEEKVYYDNAKVYEETGDAAYRPHYLMYGPGGSQQIMSKVYFNGDGNVTPPAFYGAPTPTMSDKMATLDKMSTEVVTKIIMGEESIEAFDKFVADWHNLGGQQITDEVNEWAKTNG